MSQRSVETRKPPTLDQQELNAALARVGGGRGVEDIYPLSPLQSGILFHSVLEPSQTVYVGCVSWRFRGALDPELLAQACQTVLRRHSILRTAFVADTL